MRDLIAIALGGSLGALLRYGVANGIYGWLGREFPHGTLFVNVSGSFLMGLFTELLLQRFPGSVEYRAAILIGFLGAYTTFSTFAIETLYLMEQGSVLRAALNMFLSVALCLSAVWFGLILGRRLFSDAIYPWMGHGFPYGWLVVAFCVAFLAGVGAELVFKRLEIPAQYQAAVLVVALGLISTLSTLSLSWQLTEIKTGFQGSLGIFTLAAAGNAFALWIGMLAGREL